MTTAEKLARMGIQIQNGEEMSAVDKLARLGIVADGATKEQQSLAEAAARTQAPDKTNYLTQVAGWTLPVREEPGLETGRATVQAAPAAEPLVGTPEWVEWNRRREQEQLETQQLLTGGRTREKAALDKAKEADWVNQYSEIYASLPQEMKDAFEEYARLEGTTGGKSREEMWVQDEDAVRRAQLGAKLRARTEAQGVNWQEMERYVKMHTGQKQAAEEAAAAAAYAQENAAGATAGSVGTALTAPLQAADLIGQRISRAITGSAAPLNTYSDMQRVGRTGEALRGTVAGDIEAEHGKAAAFLYNVGMSGADSLASLGAGALAPLVLASNAGASTARQAMDEGASSDQALQLGFAAAVAEGVFERISLGNLKSFKEVSVKTLKDASMNLLKTMGVNASEEMATEVANILADGLIRMDESALGREGQAAYDQAIADGASEEAAEKARWKAMGLAAIKQVGLAGLSGALMGFGFGVGGNAVAYGTNKLNAPKTGAETAAAEGGELAAQKEKAPPAAEEAGEAQKEEPLVGTPEWMEQQKAQAAEAQPAQPELPGMVMSPDGTQMRFEAPAEQAAQPLVGTPEWVMPDAEQEAQAAAREEELAAREEAMAERDTLEQAVPAEREAEPEDDSWVETYRTEEEFDPEDGREAVSERTRAEVKDLGARYGRKVRFENLPTGENGYYDNATGEIVISSRLRPGQAAMTVMKHELTHSTEGGEAYAQLRQHIAAGGKMVNRWLSKVSRRAGQQFESVEAYAEWLRAEYARRGVELDGEGAMQEAVANFVQDELFASEAAIKELAEGNRSLAKRILDFIREAIGRVTGSEKAELQKLERLYQKALRETEGESGSGKTERQYSVDGFEPNKSGQELTEWSVLNALYDAKSRGSRKENVILLGKIPDNISEITGITGDLYLLRNHIYENMVTEKIAQKEGRYRKGARYHDIDIEIMADAIMHIKEPDIVVGTKTNDGNPAVILYLPERGPLRNPLYGVLSFYAKEGVNGNFEKRPHITLTIAERPIEKRGDNGEKGGRKGIADIVEEAQEKGTLLVFDKKTRTASAVIAQTKSLGNVQETVLNKNIARFKKEINRFKEKEKISYSLDLLAEVNEGIAAEQKRKAEKVAETMDYGNLGAMKRRVGEESYAQLSRRNRQLEEQVKALKEEFRLTQGHRMDAKYIHALAGKLLHDKASGYDRSRFETELTELFEGIANDKEMSWEAAMAQAAGLMRRVLESSSRAEPSLREQDSRYEELYKALGGTIALRPEEYRAVTAAFGKPAGGRILGLRVKQGDSTDRSLDDRNHNELSRSWPEFFGPELTDAEAVFEAMAEARRVVNEKQYVNDYAQEMESAAAEAAQELFEAYMRAPEKHTFADKQAKKLEQVKAAYSERLLRQREQNRESWEKREARLKGQMERTKAQAAKQVEKAREETAQAKRREKLAVDTQYKKELRRSIEKSRSWFTQVVTRPSNEKKVPRDLMQAAAKVAELVNLMDVDEERADAEYQKKLSETLAKIRQVQKSQDYAISSQWAESGVVAMIEELQEELIDAGEYKPLAKMERYQLEAVDKILKAIKHNMTEANKLIDMETRASVQEFAEEATQEVRMSRGVKEGKGSHARQVKADWQMMIMSPRTFFNSISGWKHGKVDQLRQELNRGQKQMFRLQKEAAAYFEEVTGRENQKKMDAFSGRKAKMVDIGFKDAATGEKVPVSHAQLCSIWMHLQNEQNLNHMMHGGLAVPDPELYAAGRTTEAFAKSKRVLLGDPELAMELRGRIEKAMDDYDRAWVKKARPFFDEWCRQRINETSLKLVGFSKAGIENYFPINSDKNFADRDFSTIIMNGSIEGMGMLKERVAKAANPIMLEDINKVISRQSENVSLYAGMAIPVRNFNRIWNASSAGWEDSLHNAVAHKWGSQAVKYVDDLMGDLNKSPARRKDKSPLSSLLGQVRRNYAQAVLTINPNSAVSQVSGYPTAASVLGWKAINKGWGDFASMTLPGGRKRLLEQVQAEMAEHSPLGWVRQKGATQELYDMQANPTWFTRLANKWESTSKLIGWLDRMDENTVAGIWQAAKYAAQEQMGLQPEKTVKGMGVTEQMRAALNTVMEMEAVAEVPLGEGRVPYTGDNKKDAEAELEHLLRDRGSIERPGFGKVQFTRKGVQHNVALGNGPAKQAAVAAVRKVIEKGKEIGWDPNHKGKGFDTYTFAAPVTMDGKKAAVAVVVKEFKDQKGNIAYYIHEIYDEKGNFVQLDGETKNSGGIHGLTTLVSANATAVNKRFESFVDIVAQALGKNKENTAIRFESKAQEEAYWAKVTDLFERAVEETQPNYTPMQQAAIARSPNEINSFATMFKSPTLANANVLMDAIGEYKEAMRTGGQAKQKKAREQLGRAAGAQIAQALLWATVSVAAKGIFFAKWDDDRDETGTVTAMQTMGNILYNATGSLVDAASPIGGEMIFDAVASALTGKKYWGGIDNQALDLVGDIIADLNSLIDEGASWKELGNTIVDLCTAFGVPAIEARNWVKGAMAVADDIKTREFAQGSYETTATNVAAAAGKAMKGKRNYDLTNAQRVVDRWYRDWQAKNPEGETEATRSSLKSALRKAHREEYLAADEETRQKMAEILTGLTLEGESIIDQEYLDKWVFDAADETARPELEGKVSDSLLEQGAYDKLTEEQQAKAEDYAADYAGYLANIRTGRKDWTEGAKWQQELWKRAGKDEDKAAQLLGEAALVKAVFAGITGEGSKERKIQALEALGCSRRQAEELYELYG